MNKKGRSISKIIDNLLVWILFFFSFISASPVFPYLNIRGIYFLIIALLILIIPLILTQLMFKNWFIITLLIIMISSSITALYWLDIKFILSSLFLLVSLFLIQYINYDILDKYIKIATLFLFFN